MTIKQDVKIDLIMYEPHCVKLFFVDLLTSAVVCLLLPLTY